MSGWPSLDRSDDRRLAEALATGDADALPQIFDGHAARLFDYSHALLRDQELAASVLGDTLLAATAHIGRLAYPDHFRAWLYALVRNECLRRLHDPGRPPDPGLVRDPWHGQARPRQEAPEVEGAFLSSEERSRRQETRQLVHSALSGLSGRQREALDLMLRHALDVGEIAGVLGMSEQDAAGLAEEAQARLEDALAAAMIARTGRDECPSIAALVDSSEWPLSPAVCRKVIRHIETCPTCAERRSHMVVAGGRLLGVLPVALMPAELRGSVLSAAQSPALEAEQARAAAAERAEPLDERGWPLPVEQAGQRTAGRAGRTSSDVPRLWPAIAAAVVVMMVVGGAFVLVPALSGSSGPPSAKGSPSTTAPGLDDAAESPGDLEESPTESPEETPSVTPTTPTPSVSSSSPEPEPTVPSPRPTRTRPRPATGTLAVSGCSIGPEATSCTITLSARGGAVRWSVRSAQRVSASGGGTLQAGASTSVTATRPECDAGQAGGTGTVLFSPNGAAPVRWTCPDQQTPDPPEPPRR